MKILFFLLLLPTMTLANEASYNNRFCEEVGGCSKYPSAKLGDTYLWQAGNLKSLFGVWSYLEDLLGR